MPIDNPAELFYLVNENDEVVGSVTRGDAHRDPNKIHRAVEVILSNKKGEILLQKRSLQKDTDPGKWATSAGGHVTYGQTYEQAAYRELEEELGISVPLTFHSTYFFPEAHESEFAAIFLGEYHKIPNKLDPDEVTEVRWVNRDELKNYHQKKLLTAMAARALEILGLL